MLIDNPKPFIILIFPRLAPPFLVLGEHFMLKDLPFYEVTCLVDSKTRQARLEEQERKCQEGTLRQALVAGRPSSSSVVRPPAQKKKKTMAHPIQKARTLLPTSPSSSSASSSSSFSHFLSFSNEPEIGVGQLMPPIICEEEEEEKDMASNLRVEFPERQCKHLSESTLSIPLIRRKSARNLP